MWEWRLVRKHNCVLIIRVTARAEGCWENSLVPSSYQLCHLFSNPVSQAEISTLLLREMKTGDNCGTDTSGNPNMFSSGLHPTWSGFLSSYWWEQSTKHIDQCKKVFSVESKYQSHEYKTSKILSPLDILNMPSDRTKSLLTCRFVLVPDWGWTKKMIPRKEWLCSCW